MNFLCLHDPWIVPDPGDHTRFGDVMPLSPVESAYQAIQSATPSTPSLDELSPDPFRVIFPTDEMIMSVMGDTPWTMGIIVPYLFLEQHTLENYQRILTPSPFVVISPIPVVSIDPFTTGGIAFMTCHPPSAGGHGYNIVAMDYFMKMGRGEVNI
jgi:hypothetical protein